MSEAIDNAISGLRSEIETKQSEVTRLKMALETLEKIEGWDKGQLELSLGKVATARSRRTRTPKEKNGVGIGRGKRSGCASEKLREMFRGGETDPKEAARVAGCHPTQAYQIFSKEFGGGRKKPAPTGEGLLPKPRGLEGTADEIAQVNDLRKKGLSIVQVSERMGLPAGQVERIFLRATEAEKLRGQIRGGN